MRLIAIVLLMLVAGATPAQQYPSRTVRIIVHCPPGCGPDITSRLLAQHLSDALGQPFIVENRTGSNGVIAGDLVAKSTPDGHTLALCIDSQIAINPHVYTNMPFDPLKDLVPIATIFSNEFLLVVHPSLPTKSFEDFVALARRASPPLAYSSGGNGSLFHLTMEMLRSRAGIELVHVPYKGGAPATTAIIAGEVSAAFAGASAVPQVKAGKLRALAVAGKKRVASLPDVPTISEYYPGLTNSVWGALCAPRGTPEPVLARLRTEVNKTLALPEIRERFGRVGALEPYVTTPEEMAELIRSDYARYGKIAREIGVKAD